MKVTMSGGAPWGFKMTGGHDFRQPLAIATVKPGSKADRAGIAEGHHIYTVNGEDVTKLKHLDAQNKIKAAKTSLTLEISNAPVPKPTAPEPSVPAYSAPAASSYAPAPASSSAYRKPATSYAPANKSYSSGNNPPTAYNSSYAPTHSKSVSLPSHTSTPKSPTMYSSPHSKASSFEDAKNGPPDVEYRAVDSRDSYRRMYKESADWTPTAHQSTQQSPSMQALLRSSEYSSSSVPDSEKQKLQITTEIRDMILEEEDGRQNGRTASAHNGSLRPTGAKIYDHPSSYNRPPSSPAPYSSPSNSSSPPQPASYAPQSSYSSPPQSTNTKSKAIGNISKFLQTSGAKQGQPVFAKPLQDLQCPYGDPAVLEIRIGNTLPVPTVSWYHNEKPVRESKEKDIKFLSKGIVHTLVLGEFTPEFSGRYRCVLTNKHGSTSCQSFLSEEQLPNNSGYAPAPTNYGNSSSRYQPSSYQAPSNNYQQQLSTQNNKPANVIASNSIGLYGKNAVNESYAAQTAKRPSREEPEESEVMRALREDGGQEAKPHHRSRSMRLLEETLMPESDEL